ncbi:hypothetical protein D3C71_1921470 [compost metagenome]
MGSSHAVAFEADAAHQGIGLDHPIQRLGDDLPGTGHDRLHGIGLEHLVAQLGNRH